MGGKVFATSALMQFEVQHFRCLLMFEVSSTKSRTKDGSGSPARAGEAFSCARELRAARATLRKRRLVKAADCQKQYYLYAKIAQNSKKQSLALLCACKTTILIALE